MRKRISLLGQATAAFALMTITASGQKTVAAAPTYNGIKVELTDEDGYWHDIVGFTSNGVVYGEYKSWSDPNITNFSWREGASEVRVTTERTRVLLRNSGRFVLADGFIPDTLTRTPRLHFAKLDIGDNQIDATIVEYPDFLRRFFSWGQMSDNNLISGTRDDGQAKQAMVWQGNSDIVHHLYTQEGWYSQATCISTDGTKVGGTWFKPDPTNPFRSKDDHGIIWRLVGTKYKPLVLMQPPTALNTRVVAVNNLGQAVGTAFYSTDTTEHIIRISVSGNCRDLGRGTPVDIDSNGDIIAMAQIADSSGTSRTEAVIFKAGSSIPLLLNKIARPVSGDSFEIFPIVRLFRFDSKSNILAQTVLSPYLLKPD